MMSSFEKRKSRLASHTGRVLFIGDPLRFGYLPSRSVLNFHGVNLEATIFVLVSFALWSLFAREGQIASNHLVLFVHPLVTKFAKIKVATHSAFQTHSLDLTFATVAISSENENGLLLISIGNWAWRPWRGWPWRRGRSIIFCEEKLRNYKVMRFANQCCQSFFGYAFT